MNNLMLDSTSGYRLMWKEKDVSNIIFLDKRIEVKPMILADAKYLPFNDKAFGSIVCDPPHMIGNHMKSVWEGEAFMPNYIKGRTFNIQHKCTTLNDIFIEKFSFFKSRSEAVSFMYYTNKEFYRVLEDEGKVLYKVIDAKTRGGITLNMIKSLYSHFSVEVTPNIAIKNKNDYGGSVKNRGFWLTLKKRNT